MEEVPNLINIGPTNPIQILNQHDFFFNFVYVLQMIVGNYVHKQCVW